MRVTRPPCCCALRRRRYAATEHLLTADRQHRPRHPLPSECRSAAERKPSRYCVTRTLRAGGGDLIARTPASWSSQRPPVSGGRRGRLFDRMPGASRLFGGRLFSTIAPRVTVRILSNTRNGNETLQIEPQIAHPDSSSHRLSCATGHAQRPSAPATAPYGRNAGSDCRLPSALPARRSLHPGAREWLGPRTRFAGRQRTFYYTNKYPGLYW